MSAENYKQDIYPFVIEYINKNIDHEFHREITSDYSERKGKYIRPSLVMMTAGAMGFDINKAIPVAAAMQISEDWLLIHDDIEDDSLERRGLPTLHRQIGIPLAINAGDALHALNWQLIHEIGNESIYQEFKKILNQTILGQTIEIDWSQNKKFNLSLDDVYQIIESKTCYYTISGPMRLGAILAGASSQQLDLLYEFGLSLGKSYQIIDDYLDLTSDFDGQKKQQCNDLYEGKRTVFLVHLLNNCQDPKIIEILSKDRSSKTESEVNYILDLMKKHGSLEYGYNLAKEFSGKALEIFNKDLTFLKVEPYRDQLAQTIDFIVNRKK